MSITLPRYVTAKPIKAGTAYYWNCPAAYRGQGCPYKSAPLGIGLSEAQLEAAARIWNDRLDEWRDERRGLLPAKRTPDYGTLAWLCHEYQRHRAFTERVAADNRADYRRIFDRVCAREQRRRPGRTLGEAELPRIGVRAAQGVYEALLREGAVRPAEKAVTYCKTMWKRMRPHYPDLIDGNPWEAVVIKRRRKATKPAVDREAVYAFAAGAIRSKRYADRVAALCAVICFEWHMRPENLCSGLFTWNDYRPATRPDHIRIAHGKNQAVVWIPLEDEAGEPLFPEAEAILTLAPRHGVMAVCNAQGQLYHPTTLSKIVRRAADENGFAGFTLDACRHGGLTELEEAQLTEGQGRLLSGHKTNLAYRGYAKITDRRMYDAATKRRQFVERNVSGTFIQNGRRNRIQNE